jgi:hypothetical protein
MSGLNGTALQSCAGVGTGPDLLTAGKSGVTSRFRQAHVGWRWI